MVGELVLHVVGATYQLCLHAQPRGIHPAALCEGPLLPLQRLSADAPFGVSDRTSPGSSLP